MLKSICVLFSVLFVAPLASAEVFKCVGKSGESLYQNFPCQFESIGSTPIDTQDTQSPKKSPPPVDAQSAKKLPTVPAEPRVGMTTEEVKAIWGEPTDTVQEEPGNGPRYEVWSYGESRSVHFDRRGRVTAIIL